MAAVGGGNSGGDVSDIAPLIQSYFLPSPDLNHALSLKNQLSGEDASWAVGEFMQAERKCGSSCLRYLTTAWIWHESNLSKWPDPYEINCPKDGSEPSIICTSSNFQIAGYQAAGQAMANNYIKDFNASYGTDQLKQILQNVLDNSKHASKSTWNYTDSSQIDSLLFSESGLTNAVGKLLVPGDISIDDIATHASFNPSQSDGNDFWAKRKQLYTLLLGKDPQMVIRLNSHAVSQSDLINNCLKHIRQPSYPSSSDPASTPCYKDAGYYSKRWAQELSDIIAALWMWDNHKTDLSPLSGGGGSVNGDKLEQLTAYAHTIANRTELGTNCDDVAGLAWACRNVQPYTANNYTTETYAGTSNATTQQCTDLVRGAVGLADGTNYGLSRSVTYMMKDWQNHSWPYFTYYNSDHHTVLNSIKPGCAMFQFTSFDANGNPTQGPGTHQHASMVTEVNIDATTGDGYILTRESNAPSSTKKFIVGGWDFAKVYYPNVAFGCR